MKLKGEFSILALILHLFLLGAAGMMYWHMSKFYYSGEITPGDALFYVTVPVYVLFCLFAVISPLVSIKNIYVDDTMITYKYLLYRKSYSLKDIDGCFTMEIPSKDTTYETIYPVSGNRILPPISSFYTGNYDDFKKDFPLNTMGKIKFSWKNYLTVTVFKKYNELDR